jgi:hypothetical protein
MFEARLFDDAFGLALSQSGRTAKLWDTPRKQSPEIVYQGGFGTKLAPFAHDMHLVN